MDVKRGSALYRCVSRAPEEARANLTHVGRLLSAGEESGVIEGDGLIVALKPIESLSKVARSLACRVEVSLAERPRSPLFVIEKDAFDRIASRLLLHGDTTVIGAVQRVGGATGMRCLLRVPDRHRILYCDVEGEALVRRLGQHLYEEIAATGEATWIHSTWTIYRFRIRDFTQPKFGAAAESIEELRKAGLKAWDKIGDPEKFIQELRS